MNILPSPTAEVKALQEVLTKRGWVLTETADLSEYWTFPSNGEVYRLPMNVTRRETVAAHCDRIAFLETTNGKVCRLPAAPTKKTPAPLKKKAPTAPKKPHPGSVLPPGTNNRRSLLIKKASLILASSRLTVDEVDGLVAMIARAARKIVTTSLEDLR